MRFTLLAIITLAPHAAAQSINLDLGDQGGSPGIHFLGGLSQRGSWNVGDPLQPMPLLDLHGDPSGVTWTAQGAGAQIFHPAFGGQPGRLSNDGYAIEGVSTYRFAGLEPGVYDVATFAYQPAPGPLQLMEVEVVGSGVGSALVGNPILCSGFRGSYVQHPVESAGSIEVRVTELGAAGTVSGFQVRKRVPGLGPRTAVPFDVPVPYSRDFVVDGDVAVLSAEPPADCAPSPDRLFVHERTASGWPAVDVLPFPPGTVSRGILHVDLDDDTCVAALAGQWFCGGTRSSYYVFERGPAGWARVADFQYGPGGFSADSVAVLGARALFGVGEPGQVIVVDRAPATGWVPTQTLMGSDQQPDSRFGSSVALSGDYALVGAPRQDEGGLADAGAVYVFRRSATGWVQVDKWTSPSPIYDGRYGHRLAADGEWVVVGSPQGVTADGFAEVWRRTATGFEKVDTLGPTSSFGAVFFGTDLDIDGDQIVVSATTWSTPCTSVGAVFLYERAGSSWTEVQRIDRPADPLHPTANPPAVFGGHAFGYGVSLSTGNLIVTDADVPRSFFLVDCPVRLGERFCVPQVANSTGFVAGIDALGTAQLSAGSFRVAAAHLPPHQFGYFLASMTDGFVSGPGGSLGNLCLTGTIARLVDQVASSGPSGRFEILVDTSAIPTSPAQPILAGQRWSFQAWYRDGANSNFTDAVGVTFE